MYRVDYVIKEGDKVYLPIIVVDTDGNYVDFDSATVKVIRLENVSGYLGYVGNIDYSDGFAWDDSAPEIYRTKQFDTGIYGIEFPAVDLKWYGTYVFDVKLNSASTLEEDHFVFVVRYVENRDPYAV